MTSAFNGYGSSSVLSKSQESLIKFVNCLDEGFELLEFIFDKQGNIVDFEFLEVNPSYEKQTGLKAADLIGKRKKKVAPAAEQRWYDYAIQASKTGKTTQYEYYNDKVNGYFETKFIPLSTSQIAILFKDITERKKIEKELGENQKKYRDLTETTNDFVWEMDTQGRYTYCSPQMKKLWGLNPSDMIGKTPFDVMPPSDRERALELFLKIGNSTEPFSGLQTTAYDSQGHIIFVETNGVPFFNEHGKLLGFRGISRDITERKKTEEALKESEERLKIYLEDSPAAVFVANSDGKFLYANEAAGKLLGYSKEEFLNMTVLDVSLEDERNINLERFNQLRKTGKAFGEMRFKRKDGSPVFVIFNATKLPDGKIIANCENLTELKKTEEAVKQSEAKYKQLVDKLPEMIFEIDNKGRVVFANLRARELTGYSKEEFESDFDANRLVAAEDVERSRKNMRETLSGKMRHSNEYIWEKKDGSRIPVLLTSAPIIKDDKVVGVRGIIVDMTERKNMEKLLKDNERLAAIGQTAGMIGHDIRNPLQAIIGELYLAKEDIAQTPESKHKQESLESVNFIEEQIVYINKIVSDLQDYARPLNPEYTIVDLSDLVVSVFNTITLPDNIKLHVNMKGSMQLKTDSTFVKRSITNLVNNALQAMPNGGELGLSARKTEERIVICVSDTGQGIPEHVKANLFTPLTTTKAKGQGLGLAVVKRLVEALEGKVSFESELGKGTNFTIELPTQ